MADASFVQNNFLGGEWSQAFSGRTDHPNYKKALTYCRNQYPTAEGSITRRPGFAFLATTRAGVAGRLLPFQFANEVPYNIELTAGHMRFFNGPGLVFNDDQETMAAISTANPAKFTTSTAHTWTNGTQIQFTVATPSYPDVCALLQNRQFELYNVSGTTFNAKDPVTAAALSGVSLNIDLAHVGVTARSVLDLATPWSGTSWEDVRLVQGPTNNVFLSPDVKPYELTLTPDPANSALAEGTLAAANIIDGPYLDTDTTGAFLKPILLDVTKPNLVSFYIDFPTWSTNTSYNVGALVVYTTGAYRSLVDDNLGNTPNVSPTFWESVDAGVINGDGGFTSADVGRCVRVLSEPEEWDGATAYAVDDAVRYDGVYYQSLTAANTGKKPDANVADWIPTTDTNVATWTWGRIISTDTGLNPRFKLEILGPALLYVSGTAGPTIHSFRLGLYGGGGGHGWPRCGVYHQGRLWLGGAVENRFDASRSNQFFDFAPTGPDGTVADNNAISGTLNSNEINQIYWMVTSGQGILAGSKGGEWLIQASALNDPISPTNIQANEVTHYGCANVPPVKAGIATVLVQRHQRKVMEFLSDSFSGKYSAPDLSEATKHFTSGKIAELAYQEELSPMIWVRAAGGIYGITYRRVSPFVTDAPSFAAWHKVTFGYDATVESICVGPANGADDTIDVLSCVVDDGTVDCRHVMAQVLPLVETDSLYAAHHLDGAVVPYNCLVTTSGGAQGLQIYGLHHLNGQNADVWCCGLDCGTYAVAGGTCFVPFGSDADGLFTLTFAQSLTGSTNLFGDTTSRMSAGSGATVYYIPLVVGRCFTTVGQMLRPGSAEDAGSRNGPPLTKIRRAQDIGFLLLNCITGTIEFTTVGNESSSTVRTLNFTNAAGTPYTALQLFSGSHTDTLDDDYNLDTMFYWSIDRPQPMTILQIQLFLQTQDK